jgi:hypothetical protein
VSNQLVILGVKANSWAWGVEQSLALKKIGASVTALDFDADKRRLSPRAKFKELVMPDGKFENIYVQQKISGELKKEIIAKSKSWVKLNIGNENWVESRLDGLPIGRIVMSNFARIAGTQKFDLNIIPHNFQRKVVFLSILADFAYFKFALEHTEISLSNGRSPIEAVMLFRARQNGQKVNVMERGANKRKMFVFGTSPHYAPDWWESLRTTSQNTSPSKRINTSREYWEIRMTGRDDLSGRNWNLGESKSHLPEFASAESIVFFCTSQHEVPVIEEFETVNLGFPNQMMAVRTLADVCKAMGKRLILKRHPNSISTDGTDREATDWEWAKSNPNVVYLEPASKVDSSALLEKALAVLVFKSSVGVEASARGIPARAMGPAKWAYTEEARAWSLGSLQEFLKNPTVLDASVHETWGTFVGFFGAPLVCFREIAGGYAESLSGEKIFSSDYYDKSFSTFLDKAKNKLWSIKVRLESK